MRSAVMGVLAVLLAALTVVASLAKLVGFTDMPWGLVLAGLWIVPLFASVLAINAGFFGLLLFLSRLGERKQKLSQPLEHADRSEL